MLVPPPPYLITLGFSAVPFGHMYDDCQAIRVGPLRPLIMLSISTEETGP